MRKLVYTIAVCLAASVALTGSAKIKTLMGTAIRYTFSDTTFTGADAEARLNRYVKEMKDFDVNITAPEGYKSIDMRERQNMRDVIYGGKYGASALSDLIMVVLESDDNDAVFCFPYIFYGDSAGVTRGARDVVFDIRQAHNKDMDNSLANDTMDVRPYLTIIAQEDMSEYAGADTVAIFDLPLTKSFLSQYPNCVGVYLRKKNYPAMNLKIALSDEAFENKDKYIKLLLDNISYGDHPAEYLVRSEEITAKAGWRDRFE